MQAPVGHIAFGPFCLNIEAPRLLRDGVELELRPQALYALTTLVQNSGRCVAYEDMISAAWHGICVSRHTVAVTVGEVKKALREYGAWISYHPRFGYRLDVPKTEDLIRNGWHYWHRHTREGFEKALCSFQAAARDQGGDFRAYAGISRSWLMLGTFSMRPPREMYPAFLDAHKKASELVGLTADLRADRAQGLHIFERRVAEAESELLQAKRENPRAFGVDTRLGMLYAASGRFDDALEVIQEGYAADSLWPILPSAETLIRCWKGDFDGALASGRKILDLHPYFSLGRAYFAHALELSGQFEEAAAQYRLACVMSPDLFKLRADEAGCLARSGREAEAITILRELWQLRLSDYVDAYAIASLLCALGRHDEALDELERAEVENSTSLFILDVDHRVNDLRGSPRFLALRNRVFRNAGVTPAPGLRTLLTVPNRPKDSNPRHRAAS